MQELFHSQGQRFELYDEVRDKIRTLACRWNKVVTPALVYLAEESAYLGCPESAEDSNGILYIRIIIVPVNKHTYTCACSVNMG